MCYLDVELVDLLLLRYAVASIYQFASIVVDPTCNLRAAAASIDLFVVIDVVVAVLSMSKILSISYYSWWIVGKRWLLVMSMCFSPLVRSKK
jgi:hypothetical protein